MDVAGLQRIDRACAFAMPTGKAQEITSAVARAFIIVISFGMQV